MNKLVVLNLDGNFSEGFRVTVEISEENSSTLVEEWGRLPPVPTLPQCYQFWYNSYRSLDGQTRIKIKKGGRNFNLDLLKQECKDKAELLYHSFTTWMQAEEFRPIKEKCLEQLMPDSEVRVIIRSSDNQVRKLPWHLWDICDKYSNSEVALSGLSCQRTKRSARQNIRILIILGNSEGIQVAEDEKLLRQWCGNAQTVFLVEPERQQLNEHLWDKRGWDILFFSGHSQTEGNQGRIFLNQDDSLTLTELRYGLQIAVKQGLQVALFNSCDGLGIAAELESLHIPQVIVMREPVPDKVAQQFLKYFLEEFTSGTSLYQAVGIARKKLQAWENEYPCASWLPVIVQNFLEIPPTWQSLGAVARCPYRGLAAFREEDAGYFYGREVFTQQLVSAVMEKPLVAVVGASGSGKSSVVLAGLIPRLRKSGDWQVVCFRPGKNVFESLAVALVFLTNRRDAEGAERGGGVRLAQLEVEVELRGSDRALENIIAGVGSRVILVVDQFEELYSLGCDIGERQLFLDSLLNAVNYAPYFTLVLTLRADFYGYALSYRRFADALQNSVFNLSLMTPLELRAAIEKPAASVRVNLETGLTERLLDAVVKSPSNLPLLQFALTQLWERQHSGWLTHAAYEEIGLLELGLANYAEGIYAQLNQKDRERSHLVFLQLIQPDVCRRLATREEVGEENWDLVTRLAAARLVVTNRDAVTGVETVEIIHEALINHWQRLQQWLQMDGEFRLWQEQLRAAIGQWDNSGKDEGALLRGKTLAVAEDWLQQRFAQVSLAEGDYIGLSVKLRDREEKQKERIKQRTILGLAGGLLTALVLLAVTGGLWRQAEFQRQLAEVNQVKALGKSAQLLFTSHHQLEALTEILSAVSLLHRIPQVDEETRIGVVATLRDIVYQIRERDRLEGHKGIVASVSFSPDGQILASGSFDKTIKIWRRDGTLLQSWQGQDAVFSVSFSSDGQMLASASHDNKVYLWRRNLKTQLFENIPYLIIYDTELWAMSLSPDGKTIATASTKGNVKLWNLQGKLLKSFPAHRGKIWSLSFSPDGKTLATASADKTVKLWNLEGKLLKILLGHEDEVLGVSFSPNGKMLATAGKDRKVKLWQFDGKLIQTFQGHGEEVLHVAFSPDNRLIASASADNTVKIWRVGAEKVLETLSGHDGRVSEVSFSPDGNTLASASADKTIRIWDIHGVGATSLRGVSLSFSVDNRLLALGSRDGRVTLWHRDSQLQESFVAHDKEIVKVSFSPNSKILATVDAGGLGKFWSVESLTSQGAGWKTNLIGFSADGEVIATAGNDNLVKLWSWEGRLLYTLAGHTGKVSAIAFSPDGEILATASADKTVKIWTRQGKLLYTLRGHQGSVLAVNFSPDGKILATASADKTVKLWHPNGELLQTLPHTQSVYRVSFSPQSQVLVTASGDEMVHLWSIKGEHLHALLGHEGEVLDVSFSPDGKAIASADNHNNIILWDLDEVRLQTRACNWLEDYEKTHQHYCNVKFP